VTSADEGFRGPAPEPFHRLVAEAIEGDRDALKRVFESDGLDEWARRHRMSPALFVAARDRGFGGQAIDDFQDSYVLSAARWVLFRAVLSRIGEVLDSVDVHWIPLKGLDTAERFYPRPDLRPMSDLDVLVPIEQLKVAMDALEGSGCSFPSTRLLEKYRREEGYNWHSRAFHDVSLELHYRLWGTVPSSLVEACWNSAVSSPDLGRQGFRLALPMAFIVSAEHSWVHAGRPQFIYWWELKLIADRLEGAAEVVEAAREHGLQFPVGLAAEYVGRLWDHKLCLEIGQRLLKDIRAPERVALGRVRRRGIDAMTLEQLYVTMLLSRRPSRMGWKSVFRRVWPHPGIVESSTPSDLSWWRRRMIATATKLGMGSIIRNSEFGIRNADHPPQRIRNEE